MPREQADRFPNCDVCGRTILKGEQVHEYVTPQSQRLGVCVLCRSRAEASGWIPAEQFGSVAQAPPSRARRGEALRKRLERAASRARLSVERSRGAATQQTDTRKPPKAAPAQRAEKPRAARPKQQQPAKRPPQRQPAGQAAPAKPRPRRGPEAIMRRAVQRFNSSEERRKVAGLIRSLGAPKAAVRPDAGRQLALVTVAWELSWYQWEVSGDGDPVAVREIAKGNEVSELAEDTRAWNAAVGEDGKLRLRSASGRRKPSSKKA